ncbi:MAG: SDR family oxidoreductase [Ruminococcaceae bacterium]|nr:SDR family oxidoreductase [Oscillospiraceae bacterium]
MKTAVVTGASRGIGAACAVALAKSGYNVILGYKVNKERAENLADVLISGYGVAAIAQKADVSVSSEAQALIDTAYRNFGAVDVLVNNAGIAGYKLFTDITDEDWDEMIGTNLTGVFNCSRAAVKYMVNQKSGSIVNISSMWGQVGASCEVHYSAAKAGVIGLTQALAKELAPSGIRVNCVCPGVIKTDMLNDIDDETIASLMEETPLGRLGTPKDIADSVAFLCSDRAEFITGQILGVNGGFII